METIVVNLRREPYDVYIGRPSKWGNPFRITDTASRALVIAEYEVWLTQSSVLLDILELKGKRLGCYCSPLPCHGDVLKKYADAAIRMEDGKLIMKAGIFNMSEWKGLFGTCE